MTRRELDRQRFHEAWRKAEAEAEDCKMRAKKAVTEKDRQFWVECFNYNMERANNMFDRYMNT